MIQQHRHSTPLAPKSLEWFILTENLSKLGYVNKQHSPDNKEIIVLNLTFETSE